MTSKRTGRGLNLRQLEAFRALMMTGTVSQAADRLNVSQPAVSVLIANLERNVGFSLFERRRGRLVPTPEAGFLLDEVERAFASLDKIAHAIHEIHGMTTGFLRVASLPGPAVRFLPRVITRFLDGRTQVNVSLHSRSSVKVREWVALGQIDLGLAEMPIENPAIAWEPLIQRCVCVLPEGHPLVAKSTITPRDLENEPLISLYRDHMTTQRLEAAFRDAGVVRRVRFEVTTFATCCNFVREGAGIAFVDALTAEDFRGQGVVARRFDPAIRFEIALLRSANRPQSRLAQAFSGALKDAISDYLID